MTTARTRPQFKPPTDSLTRLFDRLPPHSPEAEMSLLGSMILDWRIIGDVLNIVRNSSDFYRPAHAALYELMVQLYDEQGSLDNVQLSERLRAQDMLDKVGGSDYLIELAESVPVPDHAQHYARIVRDHAKRRQLINAAGGILRNAYESDEASDLVVDQAEQEIFKIAESGGENEPSKLSELVQTTFEQFERRHQEGSTLTGIATGYYKLDETLSGLQRGEMIVIAARPSMGKTALALNIAEYIAIDSASASGIPVAVFSMEMSKQALAERLLCSRAGVDMQRFRRNMVRHDEIPRLQEVADELSQSPMYIDDTPGLSIVQLRAKARRLAAQHDTQVIFVDYMQLMSNPGSESRQQEVSEISRGMKALARELNVPVVVLSQLNRNPEGRESKTPMLSDLRESGSIEQDADVVMMLHREAYYHIADTEWADQNPAKANLADVIIAKQRNGPTGTIKLHFEGQTTRFHNASNEEDSLGVQ